MASAPRHRRTSRLDWLIVALACAAGAVAALAGGRIEDVLDWVFVGIPLVLAGLILAFRLLRR